MNEFLTPQGAMMFRESLLVLRCVCHALIFVSVFCYMADGQGKHRKVMGLSAAVFAGLNLAEAYRSVANFTDFARDTEPYLPGIMFLILVYVTISGGNVAKFLPRKLVDKLP